MTGRRTIDQITSDELDQLYDQLDRVRALHHPVGVVAAAEAGIEPDCATCGPNRWPCPTYTALDEPAPAATQATEPCGRLSPTTMLTTPPVPCTRQAGHDGDHADDRNVRWYNAPNEEQPMPTCTATIEGPHTPGGARVQCTREASHPENHVGPKQGDDGKVLWTDHTAGAVPHGVQREEAESGS